MRPSAVCAALNANASSGGNKSASSAPAASANANAAKNGANNDKGFISNGECSNKKTARRL